MLLKGMARICGSISQMGFSEVKIKIPQEKCYFFIKMTIHLK
jgi:hypothetical protein